MKTKYKLLLVRPIQGFKHYSAQKELSILLGKKAANPALALPLLAALTPDHYDIVIVDEEVSEIPEDYTPDIVGITLLASNAERGYEIANKFKAKGAKIIFGGPHVSYEVDEGLEYSDTVVIGEAEGLWQDVLIDFENNQLKKTYKLETTPEYKESPIPRWDLMQTDKYISLNIQASRGCPFQCEFCLTSQMFGRKMRFRGIDNVIEEVKASPIKNIFFCDDNLTINKKYALKLFEKLEPLKISWMCQSSVDVADDMSFLQKMADAGCKFILIGFESINEDSLEETHKHQNNKEKYLEIIDRVQSVGIHVYGSFIWGFDNDKKEDVPKFKDFIQKANLPVFILSILSVTKGTELYTRMLKDGRLYENAQNSYNIGSFPLIKHTHFTNHEIMSSLNDIFDDLYSFKMIRERVIPMLKKGYFSKEGNLGTITNKQKFDTTTLLLKRFIFSLDKERRRFGKDVFKLIRTKKIAISEAISLLLMLESINQHLKKEIPQREHFFEVGELLRLPV